MAAVAHRMAPRLRKHRKLQYQNRNPGSGDCQKDLPEPRDEIDVAHVCILRYLD
jgi:hypothetical protein